MTRNLTIRREAATPDTAARRLVVRPAAVLAATLTLIAALPAVGQSPGQDSQGNRRQDLAAVYRPEGDAIARRDGNRYHNRPLYCNHMPAFVLAGDRPHLRLARHPYMDGCLMIAVARGDKAVWLHEFGDRVSRYRSGRMEWSLSDAALAGLSATLQAVTAAEGAAMAVRLVIENARPADAVIWAYGGAMKMSKPNLPNIAWELDPYGSPELLSRCFSPQECAGNRIELRNDGFVLHPALYDAAAKLPAHTVVGRCGATTNLTIADANEWLDPLKLARSKGSTLPLVCGRVELKPGRYDLYWSVQALVDGAENASTTSPAEAFNAGIERVETIARQVVVDTSDPYLNAGVAAACHALNGVFYPPVFVHGGMLWNTPFPGWRTIYGPTAFGWHDNVKAEARHYIASQEREDTKRAPKAEPALGLGQQAADSRFYGQGRIRQDNHFYNFQTQFFDMMVHAWRWTGDAELERLLRPALELQLRWSRECFDPDDDGLYESYINTWPTDSVWYAGGGGAEETAYAYRGHLAAADMAARAGDESAARAHRERAAKIRASLMRQLWIRQKGYLGLYREQQGPQRLHEDAWLYSILCPIDAGMLSTDEAAQALYYTEWGLERMRPPMGGQRCWTSNWVPSVWSTRVLYAGDNYHLALAYQQADQPDAAWEILRGNFLDSMFAGPIPGDVGSPIGGTDFTDVDSMFARTVVEGLFGYRPDYPNGQVVCAPRFPSAWDHASITTPDFSLRFTREDGRDSYSLKLHRKAGARFAVPVQAKQVTAVELGGKAIALKAAPGYGHTIVTVECPPADAFDLVIHWAGALPCRPDTEIIGETARRVELKPPIGRVTSFKDPQGAMSHAIVEDGVVKGTLSDNAGNHMVIAEVDVGPLRQSHLFKLSIRDPNAEKRREAAEVRNAPPAAKWDCIDIRPVLNGDVRTIYQQQYLSPRPNTCSVRIGTDGYSPWTFYYWSIKPPAIDLTGVPAMLKREDRVVTSQGVPFLWPGNDRNIAFTSRWDNWPRSVTAMVGRRGQAVWLLVCGTTNPMQTRIANAELRLDYADGQTDTIELVPPLNFWTLCPLRADDYSYDKDAFCLPKTPPQTVQLGKNCRAILLGRRLRPDAELKSITLETLSPEVVVGLMGITVMNVP